MSCLVAYPKNVEEGVHLTAIKVKASIMAFHRESVNCPTTFVHLTAIKVKGFVCPLFRSFKPLFAERSLACSPREPHRGFSLIDLKFISAKLSLCTP